MKRYFLNAIGINNSKGRSVDEVYERIFVDSEVSSDEIPLISGRVARTQLVHGDLFPLPLELDHYSSRNNRLLKQAVDQIAQDIGYFTKKYGSHRMGIVMGTSTSGIQESENFFTNANSGQPLNSFEYYKQEISSPSDFLSDYLDGQGIHYTVSTACTSSAKALIEARRLLNAEICDFVIVGGVDTVSSLTLDGFDSLDSVSQRLTNPFSKLRDGINIGEGCAIFIMSCEPADVEFLSYGESSDGYHLSSPDPEGLAAEMALRQALFMAGIEPSTVGYVNLHGTGTIKNDWMESHLIKRVFGLSVPVSSTKPYVGHTLGASGAQEAAMCYLALADLNYQNLLPVHLWDGIDDSELPQLNFVQKNSRMINNICMSNSFAFGGSNVSLLFKRYSK